MISWRHSILLLCLMIASFAAAAVCLNKLVRPENVPADGGYVDPFSTPIPFPTAEPSSLPARDRLKIFWLDVAQRNLPPSDPLYPSGFQLTVNHYSAMNELVTSGGLSAPVAGLIQDAYVASIRQLQQDIYLEQTQDELAAIRQQAGFELEKKSGEKVSFDGTPVFVEMVVENGSPARSSKILLAQLRSLAVIHVLGSSNPDSLASIRAILEQEMTYFTLTDEEKRAFIESESGKGDSRFDVTPDAKAAAQFIIDLLTEK